MGEWPASFDPPAVDPTLTTLPPPWDRPDADSSPANVEVFAYAPGSRLRLDTLWTDAEHPPQLQIGYSASVDDRVDVYCLVNSIPHPCRWTNEEAAVLTFHDYDPIRAWLVTLLDPPSGGFDWTLLIAQQRTGTSRATELYLERVFVFHEAVATEPRYEAALWERAVPEYRPANATITLFPSVTAEDWEDDRVRVHVQLENHEDAGGAIPAEVSFLATGRALDIETESGPAQRWSTSIERGKTHVDLSLSTAGIASGEPIFLSAIAYPGMPRIGETAEDEICVGASAGILGDLTPIQHESLIVP